jgi:hypothetical protein
MGSAGRLTRPSRCGDRVRSGRDWVAILLAVGIAAALNLITFGVVYDAITSEGPGLSSNATQVLVMGFGGIIGVLGSYVGFKAGQRYDGTDADNVTVNDDRPAAVAAGPDPSGGGHGE